MKSKENFYPKKLEIKLVQNNDVNPIKGQLQYPGQLYLVFKDLKDKHIKTMIAVYLNKDLGIIAYSIIGQGNDTFIHYDDKDLFGQAYVLRAEYFVLLHNSPNGVVNPLISEMVNIDDLKFASKKMKMPMLDYIIIGDPESAKNGKYWSLAEEEGNRHFGDYLKSPIMPKS